MHIPARPSSKFWLALPQQDSTFLISSHIVSKLRDTPLAYEHGLVRTMHFSRYPYVTGAASATLLAADLELSFWGGVDPRTSKVIDRFHPRYQFYLQDQP